MGEEKLIAEKMAWQLFKEVVSKCIALDFESEQLTTYINLQYHIKEHSAYITKKGKGE